MLGLRDPSDVSVKKKVISFKFHSKLKCNLLIVLYFNIFLMLFLFD